MKNTVISFTKKQIIQFSIGLVILMILVSVLTHRADIIYQSDSYQNKIDSLNIELKYVRKNQIALDGRIKSYSDSIFKFNNKIDSLNIALITTQIYYGNKIKSIRNYSPTQLNDFFAERYK